MSEIKNGSVPCPIQNCPRLKRPGDAMCLGHWREMTKVIKSHFWAGDPDAMRLAQVRIRWKRRQVKP